MATMCETSSTTHSVKRRDVKVTANCIQKNVQFSGEKWTLNEKKRLYRAICNYGVTDMYKIARFIRNRSVDDVKRKINHYRTLAKVKLQKEILDGKHRHIEILDKLIWKIQHLDKTPKPERTMSIGLAFKMIELFENHPNPEDCFGINFKDVYGWLADCYFGNPTKKYDIPTTAFILKVCNHITNTLYGGDIDLSSVYIPNILRPKTGVVTKTYKKTKLLTKNSTYKNKPIIKTYSKQKEVKNKKESEDLMIFKHILKEPHMNPLDVPYCYLKHK